MVCVSVFLCPAQKIDIRSPEFPSVRRARCCSSVMLPIMLLVSLLSQGHAVDYGTDFVMAFPENLAYYFPLPLSLNLKITILVPKTLVNITMNGANIYTLLHENTGVFLVPFPELTEVNQFGNCNKTVRVTSDQNITVVTSSKRGDSIQSNVVPPTTHLGLEYLIPSLNYTEFAFQVNSYNKSQFPSTSAVLMDFSYRLILINAVEDVNNIMVIMKLPNEEKKVLVTLGSYEMTQLQSSNFWFKVTATAKVAVILTNPCIDSIGCRCNMISHQIRPKQFLGTEFIYPPLSGTSKLFVTSEATVKLSYDSEEKSVEPGSTSLLPYYPDIATSNAMLKTSEPSGLRVIRPGLIIDLLPKTMFAGCFLVQKHSTLDAYALVIVETGKEGDVRLDIDPVSPQWIPITGTGYSHGNISFSKNSHIIWHLSSKIAVYMFETLASGVVSGGPAISINDQPDPNGCVVVPMEFELSNTTFSWQASHAHCKNKNMLLASPNLNFTQRKMVATLNSRNAGGVAWLGLRRNLVTSEWYWHKNVMFDFANWDNNQPASGLCVSMRMEPNGNYTWSTMRCCSTFLPLCVRDMVLVTIVTDTTII